MSDVSQITPSSNERIAMQLEAKAMGRRKRIMHGGTLCCGCHAEPPSPTHHYGRNCKNRYNREWAKARAIASRAAEKEG